MYRAKSSPIDTPWIDSVSDTGSENIIDSETQNVIEQVGAGAGAGVRVRSNSGIILDPGDDDDNDNNPGDSSMERVSVDVSSLKEQVDQLSRELSVTRDALQLTKDQSNAEINVLRTELDLQNSRHEQIISKLRARLVESELARLKMQDQLSTLVEGDAQREEKVKMRCEEMSARILDSHKWVVAELNYWKKRTDAH